MSDLTHAHWKFLSISFWFCVNSVVFEYILSKEFCLEKLLIFWQKLSMKIKSTHNFLSFQTCIWILLVKSKRFLFFFAQIKLFNKQYATKLIERKIQKDWLIIEKELIWQILIIIFRNHSLSKNFNNQTDMSHGLLAS